MITALYAGLLGLLIVFLALQVALGRKRVKIGIGGHDHPQLAVLIRAHANAVENAPLTLILLMMAEMNGLSIAAVHAAGGLLVLARVYHAHGFIRSHGTYSDGRYYGTLANWLLIVALAIFNIAMVASKAIA